jgi:fatty-acyl-CoA synthase
LAVPGEDDLGWLAQRGRLPLGYLGDADKTAATFPVIGGERMAVAGDRAQLAIDGTVILHGRDSATINSGGEKIFAEEVEQALMRHPAVSDVVVCSRPSERWGSEVCAVLALHEDQDPSDADLLAEAGAHIARYKLPKVIVRCDEVYRSPSGKVDYRWAADKVREA